MVKVRVSCPSCGGTGLLPPLGDKGEPWDVKRFFPRPCDACNCNRFIYTDKNIEEKKDEGNVTPASQTYVVGQGDC